MIIKIEEEIIVKTITMMNMKIKRIKIMIMNNHILSITSIDMLINLKIGLSIIIKKHRNIKSIIALIMILPKLKTTM